MRNPLQKYTNGGFLWFFFLGIFLLSGVLGHDPWKQDETYSFGIIYHYFTTNSWLIPESAGVPFMENPPLYYWTAILFCHFFNWLMPLYDCARLASVFYMVVSLCFIWKLSSFVAPATSMRHDNRFFSMLCLMLFAGTIGIVRHVHDMFTDVALLAGTSMAFYGVALVINEDERWRQAGIWLGMGTGVAFLSKGFVVPLILAVSGVGLLAFLPHIRTRDTLRAVLLAILSASPFLLLWPYILYRESPQLFMQWFWENNVGRFLGFSVHKLGAGNKPGYILYSAFWFAFPVFPLALLYAWRNRKYWREPYYLFPVLFSVAGLVLLDISASARALYLLPLIPAFTILAAGGLYEVPEKFLQRWNKAVHVVFIAAIFIVWLIWFSLLMHAPLPVIDRQLPYVFTPEGYQRLAIAAAVFAVLFFFKPASKDETLQFASVRIWFTGIASVWITANTLLLPWIDETKSYRSIIAQMDDYIEHSPYNQYCMNEFFLGESIAPMYEYFGTRKLNMVDGSEDALCPLLFTVTGREEPADAHHGWRVLWKGSRVLDAKDEELRLYVRDQ